MIKEQLRELLTNYGEITALIIDGWDAPWSRISYDDVPFEDIYRLVKSIQPNCLVMDLNARISSLTNKEPDSISRKIPTVCLPCLACRYSRTGSGKKVSRLPL